MKRHLGRSAAAWYAAAGALSIATLLLTVAAAPVAAQTATPDTVRVTYRTRELVFFAAGRDEGVAVGDSVDVLLGGAGTRAVRAVVLSTAQHSASARLLDPQVNVPENTRVAYLRRPVQAPTVLAAAPDTAVDADTAAPGPVIVARRPRRHASGGLHLDQFNTSSGAGFSSGQTSLGVSIDFPVGAAWSVRMRTTSRYRSTSGGLVPSGVTTIPYQFELRYEAPGGRVRASLGRFLASDALALGYLDGARLELRSGPHARFGVAAGVVPDPIRLQYSSETKRVGAWWGLQGERASGTFSAAADWAAGAVRRTTVGTQASWSPARLVTLSLYGEADVAAAWDTTRSGAQVTSLFANARVPLPGGFRFGIGAETFAAVRNWQNAADSLTLPGRYTGATLSLGHNVAGFQVDASGSSLRRSDDPAPVLRGMLTVSRGLFFLIASAERGPIADYMYATGRLTVTPATSPVTLSIGGLYGLTQIQGGGMRIQRYSARPDVSWRIGRGLLLNAGGDFGRYAGRTTLYLHTGMSYYFH